MIKHFDCNTGVARKLIPKFKGPYRISKVLKNDRFVLEDVEGFQQSRTLYIGVWTVGNINKDRMSGSDHYDSGDQEISVVRTAEL